LLLLLTFNNFQLLCYHFWVRVLTFLYLCCKAEKKKTSDLLKPLVVLVIVCCNLCDGCHLVGCAAPPRPTTLISLQLFCTLRPIPPSGASVRRHLSSTKIAANRCFFLGSEDREMPWWQYGKMVVTIGVLCVAWHYSHVPGLLVSHRVHLVELEGRLGRHQANDTPCTIHSLQGRGAEIEEDKDSPRLMAPLGKIWTGDKVVTHWSLMEAIHEADDSHVAADAQRQELMTTEEAQFNDDSGEKAGKTQMISADRRVIISPTKYPWRAHDMEMGMTSHQAPMRA